MAFGSRLMKVGLANCEAVAVELRWPRASRTACGTSDAGALTLNSMKYFSPTPASKFCWICVGVSTRLWIATMRSTPSHWRFVEVSLPSTSAKVSSQSASDCRRPGRRRHRSTRRSRRRGGLRPGCRSCTTCCRAACASMSAALVSRIGLPLALVLSLRVYACVLVHALRQRDVARVDAGRVADDVRVFLRDVGIVGPRLDR